jgi:hypothetical protein
MDGDFAVEPIIEAGAVILVLDPVIADDIGGAAINQDAARRGLNWKGV